MPPKSRRKRQLLQAQRHSLENRKALRLSPEGGISRSVIEDDQPSAAPHAGRQGSGDMLEYAIVGETSAITTSETPTNSSPGETRPTLSSHTSPESADAGLATNFRSTTDRVVTETEIMELETSDTQSSPGPATSLIVRTSCHSFARIGYIL